MGLLKEAAIKGSGVSSKRICAMVLTTIIIIQSFLLMYIPVEIANKSLFEKALFYEVLIDLFLWGAITVEWLQNYFTGKVSGLTQVGVAKAENKISDVVNENVETQNL